MEIIKKLFYRGFSKDEYRQLRSIFSEESKVVRKRPQYIIGHILIIGLLFYFLVRAFGPASFGALEWPGAADVVGVVVGTAVGTCIFYLLFKKLSKVKGGYLKFVVVFWALWMLVFGLLTTAQPHSEREWEFAIYAVLMFFGWLCCTASIMEHFCEKIFMSQKENKEAAQTE